MTNAASRLRERAIALPCLTQFLTVSALIAICTAMAMAHAASVARPFFLLAACGLAWRARQRGPWDLITFSFWIWSVTPLARRLIDYYGGFVFSNVVLITPNLISALIILDVARSPAVWRKPGIGPGVIALIAISYGLGVSLVRGEIMPGLISAADWLPPIAYFLYVIENADSLPKGEHLLRGFVMINAAVVGLYGTVQYLQPQPWDVDWVINSKMMILGHPVPYGLKPFSTLSSPGTCSLWIAMLIVVSLAYRSSASVLALPAALLVLAMTLVRSVTAVCVAAIALSLLLRGGRFVRGLVPMGAAIGLCTVAMLMADPRMADSLVQRVMTVNNLSQDASAQVRQEIYAATPRMIDENPIGLGIGAFGRGARESSGSVEAGCVDSGPLQVYLSLGWIAGSLYVASLLFAAVQGLGAALRSRADAAMPFAAVAFCGVWEMLFVNLVNLEGVVIWFSAGMAVAFRAQEQSASSKAALSEAPEERRWIHAPA